METGDPGARPEGILRAQDPARPMGNEGLLAGYPRQHARAFYIEAASLEADICIPSDRKPNALSFKHAFTKLFYNFGVDTRAILSDMMVHVAMPPRASDERMLEPRELDLHEFAAWGKGDKFLCWNPDAGESDCKRCVRICRATTRGETAPSTTTCRS